jgi:hypothetical protein
MCSPSDFARHSEKLLLGPIVLNLREKMGLTELRTSKHTDLNRATVCGLTTAVLIVDTGALSLLPPPPSLQKMQLILNIKRGRRGSYEQ